MEFQASQLSYQETGSFSAIACDYLEDQSALKPFFEHSVSIEGIKSAIRDRQAFPTKRKMLVEELRKQYKELPTNPLVMENISRLLDENCFTITTAHQPAIFTGTLYFVYKILHSIRLASYLGQQLPAYQFVPVFFMGSEDADLDELGKIYLGHEEIVWDTKQTGAVGRMKPEGLDKIILRLEGEFSVLPGGPELIGFLKESYLSSGTVQEATLKLVHALFSRYGLLVVIPDNDRFKEVMSKVFADDLFEQIPSRIVEGTVERLSANYKVQANPRDINLFYLRDQIRERIVLRDNGCYGILSGPWNFSKQELADELREFPGRFSPNVILRGLFQSILLPDLVFIGGSGELSYWMELVDLFRHYQVPYPVLLLRNSFLIINRRWSEKIRKMDLSPLQFAQAGEDLLEMLVRKESLHQLKLQAEIGEARHYYEKIKGVAHRIDATLAQHVEALQAKALNGLQELEKKLLKAEKRRFDDQRRQIEEIRSALFPQGQLQERIENFMPYYAQWGRSFLDALYQHSLALEQRFTVLEEQ